MNTIETFKQVQKADWAHFGPLQAITIMPGARLVRFAGVVGGLRVLDVACGTGVVAITAARRGAQVTGLDLTPELLAVARENAQTAGVHVDWHEGDVENMPLGTAGFDVVLSQFGHMFAPRPDVALREMLRVLKPGGIIAFSTWPPELYVGRLMALVAKYSPPPPPGISPPPLWGDPGFIRERLGGVVRDLLFDRATMIVPALSIQHNRQIIERAAGPIRRLVESLQASNPTALTAFRRESDAFAAEYFEDNVLRQDYLLTRAVKV